MKITTYDESNFTQRIVDEKHSVNKSYTKGATLT